MGEARAFQVSDEFFESRQQGVALRHADHEFRAGNESVNPDSEPLESVP